MKRLSEGDYSTISEKNKKQKRSEDNSNPVVIVLDKYPLTKDDSLELLHNKFMNQQKGKKLWIENRQFTHYGYIPIEFSKDKDFIMNLMENYTISLEESICLWDMIDDSLKVDIDIILRVYQTRVFSAQQQRQQQQQQRQFVNSDNYYSDGSDDEYYDEEFESENEKTISTLLSYLSQNERNGLKLLKELKYNDYLRHNLTDSINNLIECNNEELLLEGCQYYPEFFELLPDRYRKDRKFIIQAIQRNKIIALCIDKEMYKNVDFLREVFSIADQYPHAIVNYYINDREIILELLKRDYIIFGILPDEYKSDRDLIIQIISNSPYLYYYINSKLQLDKEIIMKVIDKIPVLNILNEQESIQEEFKNTILTNNEILLKSLNLGNAKVLQFFPQNLLQDKEFILNEIIERNYCHLENLPDPFRNDNEIIFKALSKFPKDSSSLFSLIPIYTNNRQVLLEIIKLNGSLFNNLPIQYRSDYEFIETAIQQDPYTIEFANLDIKKDRDLILKAIRMINNKKLYNRFNIEKFKNDEEIIFELVKRNPHFIQKVNSSLQRKYSIGYKATLLENGYWMKYSEEYFAERLIYCYHGAKINQSIDSANYYYLNKRKSLWPNNNFKWQE